MACETSTHLDIDSLKKFYENPTEWRFRKAFLERNVKTVSQVDRLECLSRCFINMKLYGAAYPKEVMYEVNNLSAGLGAEIEKERQKWREKCEKPAKSSSDGLNNCGNNRGRGDFNNSNRGGGWNNNNRGNDFHNSNRGGGNNWNSRSGGGGQNTWNNNSEDGNNNSNYGQGNNNRDRFNNNRNNWNDRSGWNNSRGGRGANHGVDSSYSDFAIDRNNRVSSNNSSMRDNRGNFAANSDNFNPFNAPGASNNVVPSFMSQCPPRNAINRGGATRGVQDQQYVEDNCARGFWNTSGHLFK